MSARISRTLFFRTSILNRRDVGWEGERAVKGACGKTAVFAHAPSRRRGMTTTAQHRARKPWWAALDDHSQGMWVRPHVCGLFSQNVGSFLNNLGWDRALFSRTVGTKA